MEIVSAGSFAFHYCLQSLGRCSEFHIFILLVVSHLTAKNTSVDAILKFISLETTSSGGFGISLRWGRQPSRGRGGRGANI